MAQVLLHLEAEDEALMLQDKAGGRTGIARVRLLTKRWVSQVSLRRLGAARVCTFTK